MLQKFTNIDRRYLSRIFTVIWVAFIFLVSVFGRKIQRLIPELEQYIPYFGVIFMVIIVIGAFRYFRLEHGIISANWKQLYVFSSITVIAVGLLAIIIPVITNYQIEQAHVLKYGILSLLIFFSQKNITYTRRFLLTLLLSSSVGVSEETLQIWIPDRIFDPADIILNLVSCFIGSLYASCLSFSAQKAKINNCV